MQWRCIVQLGSVTVQLNDRFKEDNAIALTY